MTDFSRASSLYGFAEFAASQGLKPAELLKEVGLPDDVLENPESLISYRKFLNLLDLCAQRSGNQLFGLQYGLHQGVGIFGPLLYLIRNAKDVSEALQELAHYYHLHSGAAEVKLELQGEHALLCYSPVDENLPSIRQGAELALGVGMQLMRTLLGSRWQPKAILLQHAPVSESSAYRRMLGLVPQFNTPFNAWVFDARLLESPLSSADENLHRLIQQHLDSLDQMSIHELPTHVQQLLRSFLPSGRVTIEQIADYMLLSTRTLQRCLAEEGTSFQNLLDKTRQAMATRYLRDSAISLTELAGLLGYSDLSAFSRAFQRWFGQSPREWQKQLPAEQQHRRLGSRQRARSRVTQLH